jgi:hypothetical protein
MQVAGVVAGAAFLLLGGPHRTVRLLRRTLRGTTNGDAAYAALPPVLRKLVDETAPGFGASKADARRELAMALHAWREDPKNRKKADKLVSETLLPPGPERAFWTMVEVAGVATAGLIARQILSRGLRSAVLGIRPSQPTGTPATAAPVAGPPGGAAGDGAASSSTPTASSSSPTAPSKAPAARSAAATGYTGWSGRQASVAGPAREPSSPPEPGPKSG